MSKTDRFINILIPMLKERSHTRKELRDRLEVNNRSITGYLNEIELLGYELKKEGNKTLRYSIREKGAPAIVTDDLELLGRLKEQAEKQGDMPTAERLEDLIMRARNIAQVYEGDMLADTLAGTGVFEAYPGPDGDKEVNRERVKMLYRAIKEKKVLRVKYRALDWTTTGEFLFAPVGLTLRSGRLYLCGKNLDNGQARALLLSRIRGVMTTGKTAEGTLPGMTDMFSHSIGAFPSEKADPVVIRVNTEQMVRILEESHVHSTAKIERKKGEAYLTMEVAIDWQLVGWILSWGAKMTPLKPAKLVKMVNEELLYIKVKAARAK